MDIVDQSNGRLYADVLVPTLTRDTPSVRLMEVAQEIARRERLGDVALYCSELAMRASFSRSVAEANPGAQECYLGSLKGEQFTPATD